MGPFRQAIVEACHSFDCDAEMRSAVGVDVGPHILSDAVVESHLEHGADAAVSVGHPHAFTYLNFGHPPDLPNPRRAKSHDLLRRVGGGGPDEGVFRHLGGQPGRVGGSER